MLPSPTERGSGAPSHRGRSAALHPSGRFLPALTLFALAFGAPALAHAQRLNIRNYTQVDGLPQAQIYAVHQDARGYIWVGSNAGLARYDGRRFHSFTSAHGLISNSVLQIDEFPSGVMVAATSVGVCFFDSGLASCVGAAEGLVRGQIRDLHLDAGGNTWVAADGGISLIGSGDRRIRTFDVGAELPTAPVMSILRDREGTLWAGTGEGLLRFNGAGWDPVSLTGPAASGVLSLYQDGHALLAGTRRGLLERRDGRFVTIPLGPDSVSIRRLAQERDGTIWAVSSDGVFRHRQGGTEFFSAENGIPAQSLWTILVDREGNIWMGSDDGLAKLVPGPFEQYTATQGLPHPFVRALTRTPDGDLWFGTRDGLAVRRGERIQEVPFSGLVPDPRVYSLAPDPGGGLMIGTAAGVVHRSPSGELAAFGTEEGLPAGLVYSLLDDEEGGLWVGTRMGVVRWSNGRISGPGHPLLKDAAALSLARDHSGRMWVGLVSGGVLLVDGDSVLSLGQDAGISNQAIWDIALDREGGVWIGTNGDGAFRVDPDGIRQLREEDGLGDNFVWQILTDRRGDVWFYTGRGLSRLSGDRLIYYGAAAGLQDMEGSAGAIEEDMEGDLWFGVGSGVYRYRPVLDQEPPAPSHLNLESITVGGTQVPSHQREFPPRPGVITFRFSAPTYRNEEGLRFRYRLAGSDDEWSETSPDPTVSFARLGHGDYVLQLEAETSRGRRSPDVLTVPFTVRASFYQTFWFMGGVGLTLALGLLQVPNLRARHLESERKRLELLVRERTKEMQENNVRLEREIQERRESERAREALESQLRQAQKMEAVGRLAGGIAHDFNNLLTSVLGHTELLELEAAPESELAVGLDEIKRSAQRGAALVSQLLAFSRQQIVQWQPVDVCEAIRDTTAMVGRVIGAQIKLELDLPETPLRVLGDPNQLGQVILNLSVNARDAMPGGGRLLIGATHRVVEETQTAPYSDPVEPGRYACILVSDDGVGMDEETLRRAFEPFFTTKEVGKGTGLGLASVYGIVHQHRGFIQVSAAEGEGAHFEIYIPEVGPENAPD